MGEALGMIETKGLSALLEASDAALVQPGSIFLEGSSLRCRGHRVSPYRWQYSRIAANGKALADGCAPAGAGGRPVSFS